MDFLKDAPMSHRGSNGLASPRLGLRDDISELVRAALKKKFKAEDFEVVTEYPAQSDHGDYATPIALSVAKKMQRPPREVAEEILGALEKPAWISKIEIAGPGFINFFLAPDFLTQFSEKILKEGAKYGTSDREKGKTVLTDTSHPNVAKPMGAHHLLSTIIGDSINKLLIAVGYKVVRDSYIGDWGTQFGKLVYAYKTWGSEAVVKKDPIPELLKLYVKFHDEAETHPELEDAGRAEFKKLEGGDKENRRLWKWIVDLSLAEFQKLYKRLGVTFDVINGESFYENRMQQIIDMGIKKGVFVEGERGALIAPFPHEKYPPAVIRKSDGATLYATRDLARIKYWEDTWHPDLMVNVVDVAQSMYFQQLFEVNSMLGLTPAKNIHVAFGRMSFPEKRMSTRKGNIILMEELLDEAEHRAYEIVVEKNPELSEENKRDVAHRVGIGAVKFAVLAQNRTTDITFTWDKMLSLEGMSAPYIQYVYARASSILAKAQGKESAEEGDKYILKEASELALARFLARFPEIVYLAAKELKPNLLANYLFDLARMFNTFYAQVQVISTQGSAQKVRLNLVLAARIVLKNGLALLGISAPEQM